MKTFEEIINENTYADTTELMKIVHDQAVDLCAEQFEIEDSYVGDGDHEQWTITKESILKIKNML